MYILLSVIRKWGKGRRRIVRGRRRRRIQSLGLGARM